MKGIVDHTFLETFRHECSEMTLTFRVQFKRSWNPGNDSISDLSEISDMRSFSIPRSSQTNSGTDWLMLIVSFLILDLEFCCGIRLGKGCKYGSMSHGFSRVASYIDVKLALLSSSDGTGSGSLLLRLFTAGSSSDLLRSTRFGRVVLPVLCLSWAEENLCSKAGSRRSLTALPNLEFLNRSSCFPWKEYVDQTVRKIGKASSI